MIYYEQIMLTLREKINMPKKIKIWKIIVITLLTIILVPICGTLTYKMIKTQGVIEDFTINSDIDAPRLVIATQKSSYKNEVVRQAVEKLKKQKIRIFVTDLTRLSKLKDSDWDAMIMLTTVESGQIQKDSHLFLQNHKDKYDRIGLIYTADSYQWKKKDVNIDSISSASVKGNIEPIVNSILDKCGTILAGMQ